MTTYTDTWKEVADTSNGKVESMAVNLIAAYTITEEGEGDYVTIKEYDNGGKDVEFRWTKEPVGEWRFFTEDGKAWDNPPKPDIEEWWSTDNSYETYASWNLYTPYAEEELAQIKAEEEQRVKEEAEAQAIAEEQAALPDAMAELSELAATNQLSIEELSDAIAELSQLVNDISEVTNG